MYKCKSCGYTFWHNLSELPRWTGENPSIENIFKRYVDMSEPDAHRWVTQVEKFKEEALKSHSEKDIDRFLRRKTGIGLTVTEEEYIDAIKNNPPVLDFDPPPETIEWAKGKNRNPRFAFGSLKLPFDIPPHEKAPRRRFLHRCPPMRRGKPDTTPKGLAMMEECHKRLAQTKDMYFKDGKYTPERQALHEQIIQRIRQNVQCVEAPPPPVAILTGGPPAAGKTTFLKSLVGWTKEEPGTPPPYLKIDIDFIRAMLPEYEGWNAGATHEESGDIVKRLLREVGYPCHSDIIWDGTMTSEKKYNEFIDELKKMGYFVYIVYVEVEVEEAKKRVLGRYRSKGRFVPLSVVDEACGKSKDNFDKLKKKVDGWMLVESYEVVDEDGEVHIAFKQLGEGGSQLPKERPYWQVTELEEPIIIEPEPEEDKQWWKSEEME
jgi:predicted ABC-type ATPase